MLIYNVTATDHCRSTASFLRNLLPDAPLSYLKKLAGSGHVTVNGAVASAEVLLRLDDVVCLKESARTRAFLAEARPDLDILYEDDWIMVFNKEPGLAVHRTAEVDDHNLVELGVRLLSRRGIQGKLRPVNRLDRGTSGAIIMAKSPTAAGMFGRMVKEEGMGKLYIAAVSGRLPAEGTITAPLNGKESETRYRVLFQGESWAFAAVYPLTGRMHQIRQHLRIVGHPILGDRRYGGPSIPGLTGHLLHSFRTGFTHPATESALRIFAPLPEQFLTFISQHAGEAFITLLSLLPELP
ncbi:MAG TPA: RluA family pseudouridine synthase [Geobacteraceae bacterium]|nr:RluA family pseudouridine synthase [Geobacteraceae bacterium]